MKTFRFPSLLIVAVISHCAAATGLAAEEGSPRERVLLNAGWQFQKGDPEGTGDALKYSNMKAWLLPTAADFVTTAGAKRPDGEAPGEKLEITQPDFDDAKWRKLDLPHDWGIEGDFEQSTSGRDRQAAVVWRGLVSEILRSSCGRRSAAVSTGTRRRDVVFRGLVQRAIRRRLAVRLRILSAGSHAVS